MFDEAQIHTMGEKSFDGNFGKWRSVRSNHAQVRQKLRQRNRSMRPFGVFLVRYFHNTRVRRMRLDIANTRVILIAKGRAIEPLAPPQFLADAALDIVAQIVRIIFRLPKRHLQHKEPLRGWFKPKCREAQRHNLASVYGVDNASTVNTVTREAVGMPR